MQFLGLKVRAATFIATGISIGLLLGCGDDSDSADAMASTADDGGVSPRGNKAGASGKSSGGQGGSSRMTGSGGASGEAPSAGTGGSDDKGDKGDNMKASAGAKATAGTGGGVEEDAGSPDAQPESLKVSVRFKAKVGKEDFACGRKYAGQGTAQTAVTPRDLRFFVSDVALIKADGTKVPVALNARAPWQSEKLALLDFEDNTGRCADGTKDLNTAITGTVPPGSYKGVSFVAGVPEDLNHKDPMQAGAPLEAAASLRWSAVAGFRFATIEMVQPTATAGAPFGLGLLHLGSTECSGGATDGAVTCAKANRATIQFDAFDVAKNSVVIDVATLFSKVDLTQTQECHSTEATCESMFAAVGIDYATGKPKDGQTFFKVE